LQIFDNEWYVVCSSDEIWRHRDGHVSALDMAALWQDEQAAFTVDPRNADDAKGEVLLEFDEHIVAYRKMRRSRLADLEN
jgi:hypothetical protein